MADDGEPRTRPERRVRREDRADLLHWIALARCLAASLDLMPQPIVLAQPGAPLRVWHANAAARQLLASSALLQMCDGVLLPQGPANADAVARVVAQVLRLGPRHPQRVHMVAVSGPAFGSLQVQALDFGASAELPVSQVLLLELHEKHPPERGLKRLRDDFQLTSKEAECAVGLYAIGSVEGFARCAGKSIHTVRSQLKAAMQKTSTRTQAGLVALVANLVND